MRAQDGSNPDPFSASDAGFAQLANNPPPAPVGTSASDGSHADRIVITWNAAAGATSYEVWRNSFNHAGTATRQAHSLTNLTYSDTAVQQGKLYYYWVKAINTQGASAFGAGDDGFSQQPGSPPPAPTELFASDGMDPDDVVLSWRDTAGATSYEVWRSPNSNSANAARIASGISDLFYRDGTTTRGVVYYYWVKAVNTHGASPLSNSDAGSTGDPDLPNPN